MKGLFKYHSENGIQRMEWITTRNAMPFYKRIFPQANTKPCLEESPSNMYVWCKPEQNNMTLDIKPESNNNFPMFF